MKYGDSLRQRSIPLWETYNIDYNDIKQLIKIHTTDAAAQPTPIPGRGQPTDRSFERDLEDELRSQHQRIDLFVQSKAGEIARRLLHLEKQVAQLKKRTAASAPHAISVRRLEKFARLEEEILKAGEDIQSLSRFVGAQRLAFQKLLKKYKKWTGSSKLSERFQKEVLDRPASFSKRDFGPLLTQWTEVLAAVRDSFDAGVQWQVESPDIATSGNPSPKLESDHGEVWCQSGSVNDFDAAFAISHLVRGGGSKASYWVHSDNLVELQVLLLQYTRLRNSSASSSSRSSPINSVAGNGVISGTKIGDEIGVFICDDLQWFAKSRSSATISESVGGAAASIRYSSSSNEAVIVVEAGCQDIQSNSRDVQTGSKPGNSYHIHKIKLKRKSLCRLFEPDFHSPQGGSESPSSDGSHANEFPREGRVCNAVRIWHAQHRDVRPLVQIQMRRTRFVGLGNTQSAGILATLDREIQIRKCPMDVFRGNEDLFTFNRGGITAKMFPHAVLDIRYDGEEGAEIVAALDRSHLTERVHGFSLGTHAVATLCQPKGMAPPVWLPVLDNDIRKLPAPIKPRDRRYPNNSNTQTINTGQSSLSTPSTADGPTGSGSSGPLIDSPPTTASEGLGDTHVNGLKKKRKSSTRREHPLRVQTNFDSPPQQPRYWNEFDDGEEASSDELYTVFVDPHSDNRHLGAQMMARIRTWGQKATSWMKLAPPQPKTTPERQPLIGDDFLFAQSSPEGDETDLENSLSPSHYAHRSQAQANYSTIQAPSIRATQASHRHDRPHLLRTLVAFFTASSIFLVVATLLVVVGFQSGVDISLAFTTAVVISVVESLVFGLLGLGMLLVASREERSGIPMVTVGLSFMLECICGSGLLVVVLSSD